MRRQLFSLSCTLLATTLLAAVCQSVPALAETAAPAASESVAIDPNYLDPGITTPTPSAAPLKTSASGEVESLRTRNSSTFRMSNGQMQTRVSLNDTNFQQPDGSFSPIDTSLVPDSRTGGLRAANTAKTISVPETIDGTAAIPTSAGDLTFQLEGATSSATGKTSGSERRWTDALPDVDVVQRALPIGIKEFLVLKSREAPSSFNYLLTLPPETSATITRTGAIEITRGSENVATLPAPFMDDVTNSNPRISASGHSDAVTYALSALGGQRKRLTITADEKWLASPDRVYPVTIDPSAFAGNLPESTTVWSGNPNQNFFTDDFPFVGSRTTGATGVFHALMRYPSVETAIPTDAVVMEARLDVTTAAVEVPGVAQTVSVRRLTEGYGSGAVTWNVRDVFNTPWITPGGTFSGSTAPSQTVSATIGATSPLYLTQIVAGWVSGQTTNNGIVLRGNTNGSQVHRLFGAGSSGTSAQRPTLVVYWQVGRGSAKAAKFFERSLTDQLGVRVNLANGNLVVSSSGLKMQSPGLPFAAGMTYNSDSASELGYPGIGWQFEPGRTRGYIDTSDNSFIYQSPDGGRYVFWPTGSGGFLTPPELGADYVLSGSEHVLTFRRGGLRLYFRVSDGVLSRVKTRDGIQQGYTYSTTSFNSADGLPVLNSVTDTAGRVHTVSNSGGVPTGVSDSSGRNVTYGYTSQRLTTIQNAAGKTTTFSYGTDGRLSKIVTPTGRRTAFTYDAAGRVASLEQNYNASGTSGPTYTWTYTPATSAGGDGQTVLTDPYAHTTTYIWDVRDRVKTVTDALGHIRDSEYNPADDILMAEDAIRVGSGSGNATTATYDTDYRFGGTTLPTGAAGIATYVEPVGSVTSRIAHWEPNTRSDGDNNKSTFGYDGVGNVKTITDSTVGGTGALITYDYNPPFPTAPICGGFAGQVCKVTDGRGKVTNLHYNALGQLDTYTPPTTSPSTLGQSVYTYDSASRVASVTDGKGQVKILKYDAVDRPTEVRINGATTCVTADIVAGNCIKTTYTDDGLTSSVLDKNITKTYAFDALNRENTRDVSGGLGLENGFWVLGYYATGTISASADYYGITQYGYNAANELVSLTEPGGNCTSTPKIRCITFSNSANGVRETTTYPTSPLTVMTEKLDNAGRMDRISVTVGGTVVQDLKYTYTNSGTDTTSVRSRIDQLATGSAPKTTSYSYDTFGQLTLASETSAIGTGTAAWTYAYDLAGNRTLSQQSKAGANYSESYGYNDANAIVSRNGSSTGWSHDGNGNMTNGLGSSVLTSGSYNALDQLTGLAAAGVTTTFRYAGASQKERLSSGSAQFRTTAIGVVMDGVSGSSTNYIRDPGGRLVALRTGTQSSGSSYYYLFDNLGSTTALVDSAGVMARTYKYDPYGRDMGMTAATGAPSNPFQYTGGYLDAGTGLYKFGLRYYDPRLGRFLSVDPTGQDPHYTYAGNRPVSAIDPSGAGLLDLAEGVIDGVGKISDRLDLAEIGKKLLDGDIEGAISDGASLLTGLAVGTACGAAIATLAAPTGGAAVIAGGICFTLSAGASEAVSQLTS